MRERADLGRVEALVHEALALEAGARAAFVELACAGDESLRRDVESLLAFERRAASFLEKPPAASVTDDQVGRRIDAWRLVARIGEGGMGNVYRAERDDGQFAQTVAVKLIRPGLDTEAIAERFRHERQLLAGLEHPGIARLLDGGSTDDGRPYLVMELIDGVRIDEHCDAHRLDLEARVALFQEVCEAVQHAHRNLVVHRDLKPSNVLVTSDGARARVKLLDFGVAKVLEPAGGAAVDATAPLERRLTPAYASPEQIRGGPISTSSDVYSLGVILFELLTGRRPYALRTGTPAQIERAVCTDPPTRPSEAVARDAEEDGPAPTTRSSRELAACRATDPARLRRALRGDLERIVLMALRKEPERRYASADALREDLDRWRRGLPVAARPDTWAYRTGRLLRRHALFFSAAAALVVMLVAATGVSATFWSRAVDDRELALREATRAGELNAFFDEMFASLEPEVAQGRDVLVRELLAPAAARLLSAPFSDPELDASLHRTFAGLYARLYLNEESARHSRIAIERLGSVRSPEDPERVAAHLGLADALDRMLHDDELEHHLQVAEAAIRKSPSTLRAEEARALELRANVAERRGDRERALELLARSRDRCIEVTGPEHRSVADRSARLAVVLKDSGRFAEAERELERARAILEAVTPPLSVHRGVLEHRIADLHAARGDFDEAARASERALVIRDAIYGPEHVLALWTVAKHASHLAQAGRDAPAPIVRRLERAPELVGELRDAVAAGFWNDLGLHELARGNPDAGESHFRRSLAICEGTRAPMPVHRVLVRCNLGLALYVRGKLCEAEAVLEPALAEAESAGAPGELRIVAAAQLAFVMADRGNPERAEPIARTALASAEAMPHESGELLARARHALGSVLLRARRFEEAERLLREAATALEEGPRGGDDQLRIVRHRIAQCLTGRGQLEESRRILEELLHEYGDDPDRNASSLAWTWNSLGLAAHAEKDLAAALECFQSGVAAIAGNARVVPGQLVEIRNNLAAIQLVLDRPAAIETLRGSVELAREHLAPGDFERLKALQALVDQLERAREVAACVPYREELLELCRAAHGEDDARTKEAARALWSLRSRVADAGGP